MASEIRGHGWVTPLPSGAVARCGGPGMCSHCQLEQTVLDYRRLMETASSDLDQALAALVDLLAAVNVATLEDPSHYRVANRCALAALVARDIVLKHGREQALHDAVQARMKGSHDGDDLA
jgi:hypothetical protein